MNSTYKLNWELNTQVKYVTHTIGLCSGMISDETTDLGFTLLINFRLNFYPTKKLMFTLNSKALSENQCQVEDIFSGLEDSTIDPLCF